MSASLKRKEISPVLRLRDIFEGMGKSKESDNRDTGDQRMVFSGNPFSIRKFDGRNFAVWKSQIQAYLVVKDVWDAIDKDPPAGSHSGATVTRDYAEWAESNMIARSILLLSLEDSQATLVLGLDKAKDIWQRLESAYENVSQVNKLVLSKQFYDSKMYENERAIDYVSRMKKIADQLRESTPGFKETDLIMRIICGLSSRYQALVTHWLTNDQWQKMTLSTLIPHLIAHEQMTNKSKPYEKQKRTEECNAASTSRSATKSKKEEKKEENSTGGTKKYSSKKEWYADQTCHGCGKKGHFKRECPTQQQESLMATTQFSKDSGDWVVDSGASRHMAFDRRLFKTYTTLDPPERVKFGNQSTALGLGSGDVEIKIMNTAIILRDVLHVPNVGRNLLSVSAATRNGNQALFTSAGVEIVNKHGKSILRAERVGNLYKVLSEAELDNEDLVASVSKQDQALSVWHERLAHASIHTIVKMRDSVEGLIGVPSKVPAKGLGDEINCEPCVRAKHARSPNNWSSSRQRSSVPGEVLHFDICGPIGKGRNNEKYILLAKDEATDYRYVINMTDKSKAHDSMKQIVTWSRADTHKLPHIIVTDNGSEFTSGKSKEWFAKESIMHKTSAPYEPSQNGFIERENRTILEAARAMLYSAGLSEKFWPDAVLTSCYILNRVVNTRNAKMTPYERHFGAKPRVSHLRIFGCTAFVKFESKKRSGYQKKLEERSRKTYLIGYERDFTYKLWDSNEKKTILSRHCKFDESKLFSATKEEYQSLDEMLTDDEVVVQEQEKLQDQVTDYVADEDAPTKHEDAIKDENWLQAMKEEIDSLQRNDTYELVEQPVGIRPIQCRWIFKNKITTDGQRKYKARLVAKGYSQRFGIDFHETYSPVARLESIRMLLAISAKMKLKMIHFDVCTAFLYGKLDEELYMQQPPGFEKGNLVCKLKRSIYGLKQAGRKWNERFSAFLTENQLQATFADACVFTNAEKLCFVSVYVDDGLICYKDDSIATDLLTEMQKEFRITTVKPTKYVGFEIKQADANIFVTQIEYIESAARKFRIDEGKQVCTPLEANTRYDLLGVGGVESPLTKQPYREIIGTLMYLCNATRPDICYATCLLARFSAHPRECHWKAARRVLNYVYCTRQLGLCYSAGTLQAFSDSDYASCTTTRKSISGVMIKYAGAPILWRSKLQTSVAESTAEAELVAANLASRDALWARQLLKDLASPPDGPTPISVDNSAAIAMIKNDQSHSRIKHIDVRMLAIRERVREKHVLVQHVSTENQEADILTKALPKPRFESNRLAMGMVFITLLMAIIEPNQALKIRLPYVKGPRQGPFHALISITDPCREIVQRIQEMATQPVHSPTAAVANQTCFELYTKDVIGALRELKGCRIPTRRKRDLLSSVTLAAQVVIGATNFIKGLSTSSLPGSETETIRRLRQEVTYASADALIDPEAVTHENMVDIETHSPSAVYHLEESKRAALHMPIAMTITSHAMAEIMAGAANIRRMSTLCREGQLATYEVAELIEVDELSSVRSNDTELITMNVDIGLGQVDTTYYIYDAYDVDLKYAMDTAFMIMALFGIIVLHRLHRHLRPDNVKTNELLPVRSTRHYGL